MAKVLVSGGSGYIASHTLIELYNKGYEAVVVDNLSNSKTECLRRVEKILGGKVKIPFYEGDIRDKKILQKIFKENEISSVMHFAGLKAVGESVKKPLLYYDNNIIGTLVLLEVMTEFNCKNIIFSSSATVYGTPERLPIDESCKTGGTTNPYGETKFMIERILTDLYKADNSFNITLLRYFNPIGAHKSGLIGEDPQGIPNNLVPYISQVATGKLKELSIYGDDYNTPDGTGKRDYIHVVDLAKGHVSALNKIEGQGLKVYNLGTGNSFSVFEVLQAYEKACGKKIPFVIKPRRSGDIDENYADCKKAKDELGWVAELSLDDMCQDSYNWQKNNPTGY